MSRRRDNKVSESSVCVSLRLSLILSKVKSQCHARHTQIKSHVFHTSSKVQESECNRPQLGPKKALVKISNFGPLLCTAFLFAVRKIPSNIIKDLFGRAPAAFLHLLGKLSELREPKWEEKTL